MNTAEKKSMMDKMIRELEDVSNSQASLLKKIAQLEADNINLGNATLNQHLPDIHEKVDERITEINTLLQAFTADRDKFVAENPVMEE